MSTPQGPQFHEGAPMDGPQPYGSPYQPAMPAAPAPAKPKRFGWLALGIAAFVALLLGIGIGGAGKGAGTAVAAPAPTVTVTQTAPAVEDSTEPAADPTEDTSTGGTYSPKKSDFKLGVKILQKECFGSAGCNVTFRIKPEYVGDQTLPTTGEIEVSYKVTGLEDSVENTFTIDDEGTAHYEKEEYGSTESKGDDLKVKVTDVSYTE